MHTRVKRLATESETRAECTTATIAAEELASPDVVDSPHIATPGVKGFFNFDEELTMEDAATVAHELKVRRTNTSELLLDRDRANMS